MYSSSDTDGVWNCGHSGVGMQSTLTSPTFRPNFPGTYVLNYTVVDGCNAPQVQKVTITAKCVSQVNAATLAVATTSSFYCNGDPSLVVSSGVTFPGAFQALNLTSYVTGSKYYTAVNFDNPIKVPYCATAAPPVTCTTVMWQVNNYTLIDKVDPTTSNFQQCCKCLYGSSVTVMNVGTSSTSRRSTESVTSRKMSVAMAEKSVQGSLPTHSTLLMGLVVPCSLLLVISLAANIFMVAKTRRD